ncbi:hypothetical protein LguiA_009436 [Lonicera macranthoides]
MESTFVIKVKYEETLRRFNACVADGKFVFDMEGLKVKVLSLFNFAPNAKLTLTYLDEDGDEVTLADDEDLYDVVRQSLNPLRITVKLNTEKGGRTYARSSGYSTPTRSPRMKHPLDASVSEILKHVPGPLNEAVSKLSKNILSLNPTSSPQALTELADNLSWMGSTFLKQVAEFQAGAETRTKSGENNDMEYSNVEVDPLAKANSENKDTKGSNVEVDPLAKANSEIPNLKKSIVLPKADLALKVSESDNGTAAEVSARPPPRSVDLNAKINQLSGLPNISPNMNLNAGVENMQTKKSNECPVGGMSSETLGELSRVNKCPFAGTVVGNDSAFLNHHRYAPQWAPFAGSYDLSDGSGSIFHRGVQCDGCGAHPITGPRFKSKVEDDYDLCSICFDKQGNEADYIRIDHPLTLRKALPLKGVSDPVHHYRVRPIMKGWGQGLKLDSRFIQDVNIVDGTIMGPSTPFRKIWRMKNNGTAVWSRGTRLMWIGGDRLSNTVSVELEVPIDGLPVKKELDVAVDFCAPDLPGRYISYWRMASAAGHKFGQRVWVLIQVDASLRDPRLQKTSDFNLNLPPTSGSINDPTINDPRVVNVNVGPMVKSNLAESENSKRGTELVEPILDAAYPNKDQELNFPINDTLLVGGGTLNPRPTEVAASVSYPVVDFSEIEPIVHCNAPSPVDSNVAVPTAPAQSEAGNEEVEQKLLRELDEMGFKQVDLNKSVLRMNEYNLQQSVDDLCGVEEWDPILDELKEMGFCNDEVNKKLLKKNNGSIKRVVMDLLNGEQA